MITPAFVSSILSPEKLDLAEVQRQREWPTRWIQKFQTMAQKQVIAEALDPDKEFSFPLIARILSRIPWLRDLPARLIAFGFRRVHPLD